MTACGLLYNSSPKWGTTSADICRLHTKLNHKWNQPQGNQSRTNSKKTIGIQSESVTYWYRGTCPANVY